MQISLLSQRKTRCFKHITLAPLVFVPTTNFRCQKTTYLCRHYLSIRQPYTLAQPPQVENPSNHHHSKGFLISTWKGFTNTPKTKGGSLTMLIFIACLLFAIFLKLIGRSTKQAVVRATLLFVLLALWFGMHIPKGIY